VVCSVEVVEQLAVRVYHRFALPILYSCSDRELMLGRAEGEGRGRGILQAQRTDLYS
jgi:hypothetical protein